MPNELTITVNGARHRVQGASDTPLLYILRNELQLNGPQFGCGLEQCGACMVLIGAQATMSCRLPVSEIGASPVTTLEGLGTAQELHPVQQAFIDEQAAQCGYCINGMIMTTAAYLNKNNKPTDAQLRTALDINLCRCGSQPRILRAAKRAAELLAQAEDE